MTLGKSKIPLSLLQNRGTLYFTVIVYRIVQATSILMYINLYLIPKGSPPITC